MYVEAATSASMRNDEMLTSRAAPGWFEDRTRIKPMNSTKTTPKRKLMITAQVINIVCACGGSCENENGSTMIDETDTTVICPDCGETYNVPSKAFNKRIA